MGPLKIFDHQQVRATVHTSRKSHPTVCIMSHDIIESIRPKSQPSGFPLLASSNPEAEVDSCALKADVQQMTIHGQPWPGAPCTMQMPSTLLHISTVDRPLLDHLIFCTAYSQYLLTNLPFKSAVFSTYPGFSRAICRCTWTKI